MRQFLIFAAFVLFAAPAAAASFDCNKASTSVEKAVCADPGLSQLDNELARAYASAYARMSREPAEQIRLGQRGWIDYAAIDCTDDAKPLKAAYDGDRLECLKSLYVSRIAALDRNGGVDGVVFYFLDTYAALPDPDADTNSYSKIASKEWSVPQIDGDDAMAKAFNAFAAAAMKGQSNETTMDPSSDLTDIYKIDVANYARITIAEENWWYGHGAAHGNYQINYFHFLKDAMRGLEAGDIFDTSIDGWADAVAELVKEALFAKSSKDDYWEDLGDVATIISSPTRWRFGSEGITFQFAPYEVSAYAAGAPTALVTWTTLELYLLANAKDVVGEY